MKFYINGFPAGLTDVQFVFQNALLANIPRNITVNGVVTVVEWSSAGVVSSIASPRSYFVDVIAPADAVRIAWRVASDPFVESFEDLPGSNYTDADRTRDEEIRAKVLSFGAGRIIIQSPLLKDGTLLLVAGDDYYRSENRAPYFDITGTGVAAWSIQSITFIVEDGALSATMTYEPVTGGIRAWLELPKTETAKLANLENVMFAIKVELVGGRTITSVKGKMIVENPTA